MTLRRRPPSPDRTRALGALATCVATLIAGCSSAETPADERSGASPTKVQATVWAVGDAGHFGHREPAVARLITGARPTLMLYLGDVYESGTAADFKLYDRVWGGLAAVTAPTPGNHDWPAHEEGYDPYWRPRVGARASSHYSFDLAGWQVISVNSELEGDAAAKQIDWLTKAAAGPGNCRIAFWHTPRYTAGEVHGDDPAVDPLWQALRGRAVLVINGHEHNMQRMMPRGGIVQLISGAGGHAERYPVNDNDERFAFVDDDHDGALRIRLSPGRAELAFVDTDRQVLGESTVRCSP